MLNGSKLENIKEIRKSIYKIHKCLLEYQANETSMRLQRRLDPYELWRLSLEDADFAWLRTISSLIVTLDEEMDKSQELSDLDVTQIVLDLRSLFFYPLPRHYAFYIRINQLKELNAELLLLLGSFLKQINEFIASDNDEPQNPSPS